MREDGAFCLILSLCTGCVEMAMPNPHTFPKLPHPSKPCSCMSWKFCSRFQFTVILQAGRLARSILVHIITRFSCSCVFHFPHGPAYWHSGLPSSRLSGPYSGSRGLFTAALQERVLQIQRSSTLAYQGNLAASIDLLHRNLADSANDAGFPARARSPRPHWGQANLGGSTGPLPLNLHAERRRCDSRTIARPCTMHPSARDLSTTHHLQPSYVIHLMCFLHIKLQMPHIRCS
jgi:hypothetical protein